LNPQDEIDRKILSMLDDEQPEPAMQSAVAEKPATDMAFKEIRDPDAGLIRPVAVSSDSIGDGEAKRVSNTQLRRMVRENAARAQQEVETVRPKSLFSRLLKR
jgi:hypothetical protein